MLPFSTRQKKEVDNLDKKALISCLFRHNFRSFTPYMQGVNLP